MVISGLDCTEITEYIYQGKEIVKLHKLLRDTFNNRKSLAMYTRITRNSHNIESEQKGDETEINSAFGVVGRRL